MIRKTIGLVTKPHFFLAGELEFEEGDEILSHQNDAVRLGLQALSEKLLHDLECRYCQEEASLDTCLAGKNGNKD